MSIVLKESDRLNKSIADFLRFVRPQEKMAAAFDIAAASVRPSIFWRTPPS